MLSWLAQLARRLRASQSAPDSNESPRDPYSYVRQPLVHRPGGRNAAVALEEPDEDETLTLVGQRS
jgi:hypothetical protein